MRFGILLISLTVCFSNSAFGGDFNPKRIYQETAKAVVLITSFERGDKNASTGTGSIISRNGMILTNAHVIFNKETNKPYDEIRIFLKPDKVTGNLRKDTSQKFKASLVQYSNKLDLALLKFQKDYSIEKLPILEFSDLKDVSIGDPVLAIGHPEQGGLWTLTTGTISSVMENFGKVQGKDVFQTETSFNRGNSGGPLIDRSGNIVGINSMIARQGKDDIAITDINFSIQSTVAVKWINSAGHTYNFATQKSTHKNKTNSFADNAGIVPVPKRDQIETKKKPAPMVKAEPQILKDSHPAPEQDSLKSDEKTGPILKNEPEILTELHPYKEQDLFQQVEDEMEDMMEEMKGRIRSR